ncbi:hypothetical protein HYV43_06440 [Candidatus Micrarchaeota archaeon]|nr:hypothetical protein [Candidatus Micrarchaeota archaeon]
MRRLGLRQVLQTTMRPWLYPSTSLKVTGQRVQVLKKHDGQFSITAE